MNIVICGPPGVGKKKLILEVKKKCGRHLEGSRYILNVANRVLNEHGISSRKDYRCDDRNYVDVQRDIILSQCEQERLTEDKGFVTDNCIMTALVLLEKCIDRSVVSDILKRHEVIECLERYKHSLVLLLSPVSFDHDDRKFLKLSPEIWSEFRESYRHFFRTYHIPFAEIQSPVNSDRISVIKEAISGNIPLESSTLANYSQKLNEKDRIIPSHFLFHLKKKRQERSIEIPTLEITEHFSKQIWTCYVNGETNRFISKEGYEKLICMQFDISVKATVVQKILLGGVFVNGKKYSFLGCSANGLKTRKCFMWQGTPEEVKEILQRHGDFSIIRTVSKRLARIGLLFSGVTQTDVVVREENILEKDDIMTTDGRFNFTDGCGGIGKTLAQQLTMAVDVSSVKKNYTPSVFQVRFQGYKGVLALDNSLRENTIMVRPSMKKFDSTEHPFIGVCDYSKPYTFGNLNKQFIMLLSGLGIKDTVFEQKQKEHLCRLTKMVEESESAIYMLQWQNKFDLAQRINEVGGINKLQQAEKDDIRKQLKRLQTSMVSKLEKLHIPITKSRNIFGVCDQANILKYNQCFIRLTMSDKPVTIKGKVVVCKNPCYLLGDVRVLTAVDDTENPAVRHLNHLVDCIVFPTRGKRPHPNEIAGSDLDGDRFFVSWDEELIPESVRPPYDYPGTDMMQTGSITDEKIIYYFSRQNETQKLIGRVDKYFKKFADLKGAESTACERLGQLFSKVIDAGKTGEEITIPVGLQPSDESDGQLESDFPKFVWSKMQQKVTSFNEGFSSELIALSGDRRMTDGISEDFIQYFAQKTYSNISEYEKFLFLWNYERRLGFENGETLEPFMDDFADFVNFSAFTVVERARAEEIGIPRKILLNALNCSKILTEEELHYFQMDSPLNAWKRYIFHQHNNFDWSFLLKALTTNEYTLIVIKMPDDVVLELQVEGRLEMGTEQPVKPGTITGLLYSRHFGYKLKYILGKEYVLDLTNSTFQLYRDRKKNLTFVWLNATDKYIKSGKGHLTKRDCDEVRNVISVELQRFNRRIYKGDRTHPRINKTPFVMIEVFAQNCQGETPYWDIYHVNDNLPVQEQVHTETEICNTFNVNFEKDFPKTYIRTEVTSEEELCEKLNEIAGDGNPHTFKSVLENWLPNKVPGEAVHPFIEMLAIFVSKVIPVVLPDYIKTVLTEVIVLMSDVLNTPKSLLLVVSMLSRLELNDLKSQLLQITLCQVTENEYIDVLENWHCFVYLDTRSCIDFIEQLQLSWTTMTGQCEDLTDDKSFLQLYVRNYGVLHLMSLVFEILEQRVEYEQDTQRRTDRKKQLEKQSSILFLKVDDTVHNEPSVVSFYKTGAIEQSASRFIGQYVMISKQMTDPGGPEMRFICVGQIESLCFAPCTLTIRIHEETPKIILHATQYWRVDLIGNIVTYQRVISAFRNIISMAEMNDIFTNIVKSCGFGASGENRFLHVPNVQKTENYAESDHLNSSQLQAVRSALNNNICMIQGPPGTGKTEVACQIIRHIVGMKTYKGILAVAETNVAADNLTRRLRNYVTVVRVGSTEGVERDLYEVSLDGQVALIAEREAKKATIRDQQGNIHKNTRLINQVLTAANVIVTTCSGAGDVRLGNFEFPFVLIDEATQTLETTLLCSLVHGVKHLVMIGDPNQLGPVAKECPKEYKSPNLPDVGELAVTLFHRWFNKKTIPVSFLEVQHRMHPDIMKFPSVEFYGGKLKAAKSVEKRRVVKFPWPSEKQICFVNINGREIRSGTSYTNLEEVDVVDKIIDVLLNVDEEDFREYRLATNQIGIITLYQGQVQKLKGRIKHNVKISSVDGFQGQERDVIVISTVRCNEKASLGFIDDPRRLNVLLTRAKSGLIVVGNKTTLMNSQIWSRWLKNAKELQKEKINPVNVDVKQNNRRGAFGLNRKATKNY